MIVSALRRFHPASLRFFSALLLLASSCLYPALAAAAGTPPGAAITYGQPAVAAAQFDGDLRRLPLAQSTAQAPRISRPLLRGPAASKLPSGQLAPLGSQQQSGPLAPMPTPILTFAGISFNDSCTGGQCGGGWPPDPNGDVGPNHYIEAVNTAYAIYNKSRNTPRRVHRRLSCGAAPPASPCTSAPQGDPVVVYDWLADRFVLTPLRVSHRVNGAVLPVHRCVEDERSGRRRVVAVCGAHGSGRRRHCRRPATSTTTASSALWHDCLYMTANAFTPAARMTASMFASFSRARSLQRCAADVLDRLLCRRRSNAIHADTRATTRARAPNRCAARNAELLRVRIGRRRGIRSAQVHRRRQLRRGGTLGAPTIVSQAQYTIPAWSIVPQPNTSRKAGHDRRSDHAEGAIPQDRRRPNRCGSRTRSEAARARPRCSGRSST